MLHKDPFIIAPATLQLITELQSLPELNEFYLVGGTALALQLGHRNSIDIDLFTVNSFEDSILLNQLREKFEVVEIYRRKNTIISLINNIKTDFIRHDYPVLNPPVINEGISMLSMEDIAAMKVHVIIQSGKRLKDFIDIYFILEHVSMNTIIESFSQKYSDTSPMIALKAITYFGEIDENMDVPILKSPLSIVQIKERIKKATLKPDLIF